MADETVALVTPTPAPVTTPVVDSSAAPVTPVAPAVEAAPVAPAPAPEVSESIVVTPAPETVLGAEPVTETTVVETPKETPTETPTEGGQSENTAPPPKYDPFALPEGITLDDKGVSDFTNLLSELELDGKADHETVQKFGQKAVDFHIKKVQEAIEGITNLYQEQWSEQKNTWKEDFLKDPEIGGNRFQTTLDAANTFIRTHGGTPEQQKELRQDLETSGLGNKKSIIGLLARAGIAMSEGRPLAAPKPVIQSKSRTQTLYGVKSA